MGLVYKSAVQEGFIHAYPEEPSAKITDALITPGKVELETKLAAVSEEEVRAIMHKLDSLANSYQNEAIAVMVGEEKNAILEAIRWIKTETKEPYGGIAGLAGNLEIAWLAPVDIGGSLLNPAATASKGLYGGTSSAVYSWLQAFVANTADDIIPEQKMKEEAGVIHLGAIDPVAVPKINKIIFKLASIEAPAQSTPFSQYNGSDLPFVRWEKPIIVGPEKTQHVSVLPYISGDSKLELLTLLISIAEDMTFTVV